MAKIGERLIVEITCDATAFAFGFVCEIQTCVSEFAVSVHQLCASGDDAAAFEYGPQKREEGECQQDRQRGRCPGKRRASYGERKTQRRRRREIFRKSYRRHRVLAWLQSLHCVLRLALDFVS